MFRKDKLGRTWLLWADSSYEKVPKDLGKTIGGISVRDHNAACSDYPKYVSPCELLDDTLATGDHFDRLIGQAKIRTARQLLIRSAENGYLTNDGKYRLCFFQNGMDDEKLSSLLENEIDTVVYADDKIRSMYLIV